jgi:hypothetical protein
MSTEYIFKTNKGSGVSPSTRRSVQFLAAVYIHAFMVVTFVISSRNVFTTAIRNVLLALLR